MAKSKTTKTKAPVGNKPTAHDEYVDGLRQKHMFDVRLALIESATQVATTSPDGATSYGVHGAACAFLKSLYESDTPKVEPTPTPSPVVEGESPSPTE